MSASDERSREIDEDIRKAEEQKKKAEALKSKVVTFMADARIIARDS